MNKDNSEYIRFIDEAVKLCKDIPRYFSRFSNKIFCNHQKIILLVLKQKLRTTYRGLIELLKISSIKSMIKLKRIPHYSTLIKFDKIIRPKLLNYLLPFRRAKTAAVDATGFELEAKSYYYRNIDTKLFDGFIRKTKRFMKLSLSVNTDKQIILAYKIRRKFRNDNIDFENILRELDIDYLVGDKGYSSKKNRDYVIHKLHAIPVIPKKKSEGVYYIKQRRKLIFNDKIYHQRSKVETIFSVIKRKYGSCLRARTFNSQRNEVIYKLIAYNLDRLSRIIKMIILGFHQSPKKGLAT